MNHCCYHSIHSAAGAEENEDEWTPSDSQWTSLQRHLYFWVSFFSLVFFSGCVCSAGPLSPFSGAGFLLVQATGASEWKVNKLHHHGCAARCLEIMNICTDLPGLVFPAVFRIHGCCKALSGVKRFVGSYLYNDTHVMEIVQMYKNLSLWIMHCLSSECFCTYSRQHAMKSTKLTLLDFRCSVRVVLWRIISSISSGTPWESA